MPRVVGRHPPPWEATPRGGRLPLSSSRGAGELGSVRLTEAALQRFGLLCGQLKVDSLKNQSSSRRQGCLDLACSPAGAPTPRPGRQGLRGGRRAGLGARSSLPGSLPGSGPNSPSEVHLARPCVPRGRGQGAGGRVWSWGRLRPASVPTLASDWPRPFPGPGSCQLTELLPGLLVGSGLLGRAGASPASTSVLAGSCFWPLPWASPAPCTGPGRWSSHLLSASHPPQA